MIDVSKYEKIGEYRDGKMIWISPKKENIVYLIMFGIESYIGSSINIRRRFSQYVPALTRGKYDAQKMQNAFNIKRSFDVYALEFADRGSLRKREEFYIKEMSPSLNTRTCCVDYRYREADPNTLHNSRNKNKELIGVQAKIPISLYNRLAKQKELHGESICDMTAQAISYWLSIQNTGRDNANDNYQYSQNVTRKRAAFSQNVTRKRRAAFSQNVTRKRAAFSQNVTRKRRAFSQNVTRKRRAAFSQNVTRKRRAAFSQNVTREKRAAFSQNVTRKKKSRIFSKCHQEKKSRIFSIMKVGSYSQGMI